MSPRTPEQCLERAAECERQAAATNDRDTLKLMRNLADQWRALAKSTVAAPPNRDGTSQCRRPGAS